MEATAVKFNEEAQTAIDDFFNNYTGKEVSEVLNETLLYHVIYGKKAGRKEIGSAHFFSYNIQKLIDVLEKSSKWHTVSN